MICILLKKLAIVDRPQISKYDRKYLKLDHVACRPEMATILFTGVGTSDRRVLPPYLLYYIFLGKSNNSLKTSDHTDFS